MFSGRLSVDTTLLLLYCRGSVGRVDLCCPVDAAWSKFSKCQNSAWIEGYDSCCPETFRCHFPGTAFISHRPQGQPQSAQDSLLPHGWRGTVSLRLTKQAWHCQKMPGQGAESSGLHEPGSSITRCHSDSPRRVRRSPPGLCGRHAHHQQQNRFFSARCGRDKNIAEPGKKYGSRHPPIVRKIVFCTLGR